MIRLGHAFIVVLSISSAFAFEPQIDLRNDTFFNQTKHRFSRSRFSAEAKTSHEFSNRWGGEVAGRLFADPVAAWNDHYTQSAKKDERWDAQWRSGYLEFQNLPWRLRVGRQEVVWGESLHYFSADLLHPQDFRDFWINDLAWARIPQTGLWSLYATENWSVEWVYFPWSEAHRRPRFSGEFFLNRTSIERAATPKPSEESRVDFSKPVLGFNAGFSWQEWRFHVMSAWRKDFNAHLENSVMRYDRLFASAITASYAREDFLIRTEFSNFSPRRLNDGLQIVSTYEWRALGSLEWNATDRLTFSAQEFWIYCTRNPLDQCRNHQTSLGFQWRDLPWDLELDSAGWFDYKDPSFWWSSHIKKPIGDFTQVQIGSEQFFGSGQSIYSELKSRDQWTARVEVKF